MSNILLNCFFILLSAGALYMDPEDTYPFYVIIICSLILLVGQLVAQPL